MTWSDKNIVFLISLPRSGSTLLQRILAAHSDVASTSESWLLLPQFYALKEGCVFSEYSHTAASRAANDFCKCLPGGHAEYLAAIKAAVLECFYNASGYGKTIYLEKTPRNSLVLEEIVSMFPKSKYVFLWRNPAAIVASMINTFSDGKWNLYRQEIDLYKGLDNMLKSDDLCIKHRMDIKYEDLVSMPRKKTDELFKFIGLDAGSCADEFINTQLQGRMGDATGVKQYSSISPQSLDKWRICFGNPLRKWWITSYIKNIGSNNLSRMGYDIDEILFSITSARNGYENLISDATRMLYGVLDSRYQISLVRRLHRNKKGKRKYTLQ